MVVGTGGTCVRGACAGGTGTGVGSGLLQGVEDVLLGGAESGLDLLDGFLDAVDVLSLVGVFQFGDSGLDGSFLVGGNLVAELLELFLGLEYDGVLIYWKLV